MKTKLIILTLLIGFLSSCKTKEIVTFTRTESVDTTITVKGENMTFLSPIQALLEPQVYETSIQRITLHFNPVSETIHVEAEVKDQEVEVTLDKKVVETTETIGGGRDKRPAFRRLFHIADALTIIGLTLIVAGVVSLIRSIRG